MKRQAHSQGRESVWVTEVDGERCLVELETGYGSESRLVWINGSLRPTRADSLHSTLDFPIGAHSCVIRIRGIGPELTIDGRLIPPFQGHILLRSATAPPDSGSLLRPARSADLSDRNLLRPHGDEDE